MREVTKTSEAYLEPSRTSTTELLCENSYGLKSVNYFRKKALSQIFDWVLNTPLNVLLTRKTHGGVL